MAISEPSTLITDYLLGVLAGVFAWRLFGASRLNRQRSIGYWAAALAATAVGSFVGGTYHGFGPAMNASTAAAMWKATTWTMGFASLFLTVSVVFASFAEPVRRTLLIAAAVKLVVYLGWMLYHDEFVYVILDYASTLLLVLALAAADRVRGTGGHRVLIAGGIFVSIAAALIQQSGVDLHRHFNHNDLMHVVQMGAIWLLYQGGRRLRDVGRTYGTRP